MLPAIIVLVFIAAMLLVMSLAAPASDQALLAKRIAAIARSGMDPAAMPSLPDAHYHVSFFQRIAGPALRQIARIAGGWTAKGHSESVRVLIERAGNPPGLGVTEFTGLRVVSIGLSAGVALLAVRFVGDTLALKLILAVICVFLGFKLPEGVLLQTIANRQRLIRKSLPDTIDLLIVSVEAGMGFDGAVAKVVEKVSGPLSEEFGRVLQEMRLGRTRGQALKSMSARVDVPELTTFVAAIYQADQLGVSIANVLRIQSETIRVKRLQRLREQAAKLPVKILFPMLFFIFPAIFVVVVGPGAINIAKAFAQF
jgi:tight adherence protein C